MGRAMSKEEATIRSGLATLRSRAASTKPDEESS